MIEMDILKRIEILEHQMKRVDKCLQHYKFKIGYVEQYIRACELQLTVIRELFKLRELIQTQ